MFNFEGGKLSNLRMGGCEERDYSLDLWVVLFILTFYIIFLCFYIIFIYSYSLFIFERLSFGGRGLFGGLEVMRGLKGGFEKAGNTSNHASRIIQQSCCRHSIIQNLFLKKRKKKKLA